MKIRKLWKLPEGRDCYLDLQSSVALLYIKIQNEAGQSFSNRTHWSEQTLSSQNTGDNSMHVCHHMVNTEIRLIIFFTVEDGDAPHSQQKQDQDLTVAQTMNTSLKNSDLNGRN